MAPRKTTEKTGTGIHVGDSVRLTFGVRKVTGKVVEYRGGIGVKGRKLYRVLVRAGSLEPINIELPADQLVIDRRTRKARKVRRVIKQRRSVIS